MAPDPELPESRWPGRQLTVLVCEHEREAAETMADLIRILGQAPLLVPDPQDAVDAAVTRPDVAILDLRMPQMDGFACCAAMRDVSPDTVFIACTDWSDQAVKRRAIAAGFQHHLVKPVGLQELEAILREVAMSAPGT